MDLFYLLIRSTILFVVFASTEGTLDLSNLDLSKVKFFKYPQQTRTGEVFFGRHQPFNIFNPIDNFNRAKAMLTYFQGVLLGGFKHKKEIAVVFHPDTGSRSRYNYQQKFGYRGERLIAALGNGYNQFKSPHYNKLVK